MSARLLNLLYILPLILIQLTAVHFKQLGKSSDGIQGCAKLMTHTREEFTFGLARCTQAMPQDAKRSNESGHHVGENDRNNNLFEFKTF